MMYGYVLCALREYEARCYGVEKEKVESGKKKGDERLQTILSRSFKAKGKMRR